MINATSKRNHIPQQNLLGSLERVRFLVSQFNSLHALYNPNPSEPFPFPMYKLQILPATSRNSSQPLPPQKSPILKPRKKYSNIRAQRVTAPLDLTCRICWVSFTTKSHWFLHTKYFHFPPSFTCSHCPKAYKYKMDLKNHIRLKHSSLPPEYTCAQCSKAFRLVAQLNRHLRTKHNSQTYPCQYCEKKFKEKIYCRHHEELHDEDKDYFCSFCPLRFLKKPGYFRHMELIHPGEH